MVEGDLWTHAQTDLTDFYCGELTLRQLWVRFSRLPPEAHIWGALQPEIDRVEAKRIEASLDQFYSTNGGGPRA